MARVQAKFTSRLSSTWRRQKEKNYDLIALQMATDVDRTAKVIAPKESGNLVNSGRIERKGEGEYEVVFGGQSGGVSVPYAKRRHYENQKNPQTLGYLERAGDGVAKQKKKYLAGKV